MKRWIVKNKMHGKIKKPEMKTKLNECSKICYKMNCFISCLILSVYASVCNICECKYV